MSNAMKVVKDAYAAFGRGDIQALLALIPADVDWRVVGPASLPYATQCRTRADVQQYLDDLLSAEEITRFEPREFIDAGEHIIVARLCRVDHQGDRQIVRVRMGAYLHSQRRSGDPLAGVLRYSRAPLALNVLARVNQQASRYRTTPV